MTAATDTRGIGTQGLGPLKGRAPRMPLRHYLQLIRFKVMTELYAEVERTYIGFLWWIIDPIISMSVYYLVFALMFRRGGPDFVPFLFVGLLTFRWLNTCVCHASMSIMLETGLMQQVYLPKVIFPIVSVLVDSVKFCLAFTLLLCVLGPFGHPIGIVWAALPVVLLVQFLLILGSSFLLAAVMPFIPDLEVVLRHVFRLLFFVSGVFYSITSIPEDYRFILRLNPMATLIEIYRGILLEERIPEWEPLAGISAFSLAAILLGYGIIRRFDRHYPKLS